MDSTRSRFIFQKVADGDTVTLVTNDGAKLCVRLYGMDALEFTGLLCGR